MMPLVTFFSLMSGLKPRKASSKGPVDSRAVVYAACVCAACRVCSLHVCNLRASLHGSTQLQVVVYTVSLRDPLSCRPSTLSVRDIVLWDRMDSLLQAPEVIALGGSFALESKELFRANAASQWGTGTGSMGK